MGPQNFFYFDNKLIFKHFWGVENMRKSSLKQTVKWQKNEAPKGLAQICMGMKMGCLFRITRDLEQPESPLW